MGFQDHLVDLRILNYHHSLAHTVEHRGYSQVHQLPSRLVRKVPVGGTGLQNIHLLHPHKESFKFHS